MGQAIEAEVPPARHNGRRIAARSSVFFSDRSSFKRARFHRRLNPPITGKTDSATDRQTGNGADQSSLVEPIRFDIGPIVDEAASTAIRPSGDTDSG